MPATGIEIILQQTITVMRIRRGEERESRPWLGSRVCNLPSGFLLRVTCLSFILFTYLITCQILCNDDNKIAVRVKVFILILFHDDKKVDGTVEEI